MYLFDIGEGSAKVTPATKQMHVHYRVYGTYVRQDGVNAKSARSKSLRFSLINDAMVNLRAMRVSGVHNTSMP